jgi:hypothetical protein
MDDDCAESDNESVLANLSDSKTPLLFDEDEDLLSEPSDPELDFDECDESEVSDPSDIDIDDPVLAYTGNIQF